LFDHTHIYVCLVNGAKVLAGRAHHGVFGSWLDLNLVLRKGLHAICG
jgi:hypothetical protein